MKNSKKNNPLHIDMLDTDVIDNVIRKSLKDLDVSTLNTVYCLASTCQIFLYICSALDKSGEKTKELVGKQALEILSCGISICQKINDDMLKELAKKPNENTQM